MGGSPSLKQVLKAAKKTYKRSGGGVASNASDFASAGGSDNEAMSGGLVEGNVNKAGNDKAAHENSGENAKGEQQGGRRRRRRRRRSRKSRRKSRRSRRKGKKSRRSRRKGKKSRKKSRRRRRR